MTSADAKCRKSPSGPLGGECGTPSSLLRVPLIPLTTTLNAVASPGSGWQLADVRVPGPVFIFWLLQHDVQLDPIVWFALAPPEHGNIEKVTVHVLGQNSGLPDGGMPRLSLIKMPLNQSANYDTFDTADPSPDANAYGLPHLIELGAADFGGAPLQLSNDFAYWIRVVGETGASARNNRLKITGITLSISP